MKLLTLGILSGCHTFFQSLSPIFGSVVIFLYPSLTLYCPDLPHPRRSLAVTHVGDEPWREERNEAAALAR